MFALMFLFQACYYRIFNIEKTMPFKKKGGDKLRTGEYS